MLNSQSTDHLVKAVRETFDRFDLDVQPELRIFCGEEPAVQVQVEVARSLLLTSSPLLRSLLSSSPSSTTLSRPDASPSKLSEVLKLLGSEWEEVLIDSHHIDILARLGVNLGSCQLVEIADAQNETEESEPVLRDIDENRSGKRELPGKKLEKP